MGSVYLGADQAGRPIALKVPSNLHSGDLQGVRRIYREALASAQIDHPNICRIVDVGQEGKDYYIVMAMIEGRTLAEVVESGEGITTEQALKWVRTLADALQAAHDSGIIHRDLKPGNVMIRPDGEPIIMDFGMARSFDGTESLLTPSGAIVGTPGYMAPEQITGRAEDVGPACDVYALGVILYELLTGWTPFSGSLATLLGSIVSDEPTPLRKHCPDLSPALEALCLRALEKEPKRRFASAREMGATIDAYLQHGEAPSVAHPPLGDGRSDDPPPARGFFRQLFGSLYRKNAASR